jgi:hypothetical protein
MSNTEQPNVTIILPGGAVVICRPDQVGEVTRQAAQPAVNPFTIPQVVPGWPYAPMSPSWPWDRVTYGTSTAPQA